MPILPNQELTTRERDFLRTYMKHCSQFSTPPSMPIMARYLEVTLRGAQYLRDKLVEKGYAMRATPARGSKPNTLVRLKFTAKAKKAIG